MMPSCTGRHGVNDPNPPLCDATNHTRLREAGGSHVRDNAIMHPPLGQAASFVNRGWLLRMAVVAVSGDALRTIRLWPGASVS